MKFLHATILVHLARFLMVYFCLFYRWFSLSSWCSWYDQRMMFVAFLQLHIEFHFHQPFIGNCCLTTVLWYLHCLRNHISIASKFLICSFTFQYISPKGVILKLTKFLFIFSPEISYGRNIQLKEYSHLLAVCGFIFDVSYKRVIFTVMF